MGCYLPVIASPVGANTSIVDHGTNGYLAETDSEWYEAFLSLYSDDNKRESMGMNGRKKVEKTYSYQVQAPRYHEALVSVIG